MIFGGGYGGAWHEPPDDFPVLIAEDYESCSFPFPAASNWRELYNLIAEGWDIDWFDYEGWIYHFRECKLNGKPVGKGLDKRVERWCRLAFFMHGEHNICKRLIADQQRLNASAGTSLVDKLDEKK